MIHVRVQPGASRSEITGVSDGRLRIRVQAPPVEGAANAAVCKLLARAVGVSKSKARVVRGERSREKTISISGLTAVQVADRLGL